MRTSPGTSRLRQWRGIPRIRLASKTGSADEELDGVVADMSLREDAYYLARQILKGEVAVDEFAGRLIDVCARARGKEFLIVHNPGGWGHARLDQCLDWERGIVIGITAAVQEMGQSLFMTQYFRSGRGWREEMRDLIEQFRFFESKAVIMADWLRFIITHIPGIQVVLIGISQGAAFGNAVMRQLSADYPVYSIELGFPFMYKSRRVVDRRTLVIEGNGVDPDIMAQGNVWTGARILTAAFFRWIGYSLKGRSIPLALCINAPGHEYDWGNPEIQRQIRDFLEANFGVKESAKKSKPPRKS